MFKRVACSLLCMILILCCFALPAFAITKNELIAKVDEGVQVNGHLVSVPANYRNAALNYLYSHDLSQAQLEHLSNSIDRIKAIMIENGITSIEELKKYKDIFEQIKSICLEVCSYMGVTWDGSNIIVSGDVIKPTGYDDNVEWMLVAFIITTLLATVSVGFAVKSLRKGRD